MSQSDSESNSRFCKLNSIVHKTCSLYVKFVVNWPSILFALTIIIVALSGFLGFWYAEPPDFANPSKGFTTKGSPLSYRRNTKLKLENEVKAKRLNTIYNMLDEFEKYDINDINESDTKVITKRDDDENKPKYIECKHMFSDDCAQIILESENENKNSILEYETLQKICHFVENELKVHLTEYKLNYTSLPHVIASYSNKTSCKKLQESDVHHFNLKLFYCEKFYPEKLADLSQFNYNQVPSECMNRDLISAFKFLIDKFLKFEPIENHDTFENEDENHIAVAAASAAIIRPIAKFTAIYLSVNKNDWKYLVNLYKQIHRHELGQFRISFNFNIKFELFNETIYESLYYLIIAIAAILIITMLYLKSFFIMFTVLMCVLFSLIQSYFLYKIIFQIQFFPFMNLMSIFLLIGLACDDVFVFYDIWLSTKKQLADSTNTDEKSSESMQKHIEERISYTLKHAIRSIFVTSITTAAAFIVNLTSNIISIRLFGVFASLTILTNFIFMIILIPSTIVAQYKITRNNRLITKLIQLKSKITNINFIKRVSNRLENLTEKLRKLHEHFFNRLLPYFIITCRYFLIVILSSIGICGTLFVFYKPTLSLPRSSTFQLYSSSNPLEYYDKHISALSDTNGVFVYQQEAIPYMRVFYLFGVKADNDGSDWHPDDLGALNYDAHNFNFYDERSQLWFSKFCATLKHSASEESEFDRDPDTVPSHTLANKYKICLFDHLKLILSRPCVANSTEMDSICCGQPSFPFDENVLRFCLSDRPFLFKFLSVYQAFLYEKLYYDMDTSMVIALEYQQITSFVWNANYERMQLSYKMIENFFQKQLKYSAVDADKNLDLRKHSFFTADFEFFDLQTSLLNGTITSFLISLVVVFVIMFLATGNFLVTLYSIIAIGLAISSTVGTLALLDWELNVVESVTIILAIGLSIDFVVHFGITYCAKAREDLEMTRDEITSECVKSLGSAVLMASLTTFLAGASMLPSDLLSFKLYGTFLMLVMLFSVLFAFFLFLPLLASVGPTNGCCMISWTSLFGYKSKSKKISSASIQKSDDNLPDVTKKESSLA